MTTAIQSASIDWTHFRLTEPGSDPAIHVNNSRNEAQTPNKLISLLEGIAQKQSECKCLIDKSNFFKNLTDQIPDNEKNFLIFNKDDIKKNIQNILNELMIESPTGTHFNLFKNKNGFFLFVDNNPSEVELNFNPQHENEIKTKSKVFYFFNFNDEIKKQDLIFDLHFFNQCKTCAQKCCDLLNELSQIIEKENKKRLEYLMRNWICIYNPSSIKAEIKHLSITKDSIFVEKNISPITKSIKNKKINTIDDFFSDSIHFLFKDIDENIKKTIEIDSCQKNHKGRILKKIFKKNNSEDHFVLLNQSREGLFILLKTNPSNLPNQNKPRKKRKKIKNQISFCDQGILFKNNKKKQNKTEIYVFSRYESVKSYLVNKPKVDCDLCQKIVKRLFKTRITDVEVNLDEIGLSGKTEFYISKQQPY